MAAQHGGGTEARAAHGRRSRRWSVTRRFVLDATFTFDKADADGAPWTAEQLSAATAASLHGYFGRVVRTGDLLM